MYYILLFIVIVDTNGCNCVIASFVFGGDTGTRSYNIHVTQFDRLNDMGGPPGCLQYWTTNTGTISTFGWQDTGSQFCLYFIFIS